MRNLKGKVAVVTGAASGIGRSLAIHLAAEGCHLALADVDSSGLSETASLIRRPEVDVTTRKMDVSDATQVNQWCEAVLEHYGRANILINNAGVALFDSIVDGSIEDFKWLFDINFWGVVYMTKAFLPHLLASNEGHVVNISSVAGFVTAPHSHAYCASKFAVRAFTKTLAQELMGSSVGATCVHPGGVKTKIARYGRLGKSSALDRELAIQATERQFRTSPDRVARRVIHAIKKKKLRLLVGADAYLMYATSRLFPVQVIKLGRRSFDLVYRNAYER